MSTGTGILLASILLGGIYLLTRETKAQPVTWDIDWEDDLPTKVTIQGKIGILV